MKRIDLEGGKYTYVLDGGEQYALRYGERWRELTGDKFVMCMAQRIEALEQQLADAHAAIKSLSTKD